MPNIKKKNNFIDTLVLRSSESARSEVGGVLGEEVGIKKASSMVYGGCLLRRRGIVYLKRSSRCRGLICPLSSFSEDWLLNSKTKVTESMIA